MHFRFSTLWHRSFRNVRDLFHSLVQLLCIIYNTNLPFMYPDDVIHNKRKFVFVLVSARVMQFIFKSKQRAPHKKIVGLSKYFGIPE